MRRTARLGDAWYPIGTNPQQPARHAGAPQCPVDRAAAPAGPRGAGRDPSTIASSPTASRSSGQGIPERADNGERRLGSGDNAAIARRSAGVARFRRRSPSISASAATRADAVHRQYAPLPRGRAGERLLAIEERQVLKLGYKASAEQFGPTRAARFLVPRRGGRVRLGLRQRPFPAVEAHRRACAELARLARRARRPHPPRGQIGTSVADADLPLSPLDRRAGLRHARRDVSGPRRARRRHRRVAERGAVERHQMAGRQGAARPAARGDRADQQIVDRGPGHASRASSTAPKTRRSTTSRSRRCRSGSPPPARWRRRWPARSPRASSAPAARAPQLYTEPARAEGRGGRREARPRRRDASSG